MCIITLSNCGIFIKFAYDFKIIRGFFSRIFEYKKKKRGEGKLEKRNPFTRCRVIYCFDIGSGLFVLFLQINYSEFFQLSILYRDWVSLFRI